MIYDKEYQALCKKHQDFIRSKMSPVEVGMVTDKGIVVVIQNIAHFDKTYCVFRDDKYYWTTANVLIFLPNLSQLTRWVPEGWKWITIGQFENGNGWSAYAKSIEPDPQDHKSVQQSAPTPEQATLLALVKVEGEG